MNTRKIYKVIVPVDRKDGKTHWVRVGSAFPNRDESINIYFDVIPMEKKIQIRELDEDDLRRRDGDASPRHRGEVRASSGSSLETEDLPF
jgi:hypothetical protein